MEDLALIFFSACLINNFTLSSFLGLCAFFGVSNKLDTAWRMGAADTFVLVVTSLATWTLNTFVLPYAPYLQLISYIVVIATAVGFLEMLIRKLSPSLFKAMGIFLPLITTNCAVLALAIFQTSRGYNLIQGLVFAVGAGAGLTLALVLVAGIREETALEPAPRLVRGVAMNFLIASILSMAFMGFAGLFAAG